MRDFNEILKASEEELLQRFYKFKDKSSGPGGPGNRLAGIAEKNRLKTEQLICALGFNSSLRGLPEILPILGYAAFDDLSRRRNDIFTSDIYKNLSLDNVRNIYATVKNDHKTLEIMQYLLNRRLQNIESHIEETVNSSIIDQYKAEMRCIYNDRIAGIDFAEERLNRQDNGFRALLSEVSIIIESKLIPVGDIFFRDSILPQEKRKILSKGLIPEELIRARLNDERTGADEKQILQEYLGPDREE